MSSLPTLRRACPGALNGFSSATHWLVDKALRARKLDRHSTILKRELEERPNDPFVLFNLRALPSSVEPGPGARFLEASLAGSAPTDSIVCKLFALIARAHQMTGDSQGALRACARG